MQVINLKDLIDNYDQNLLDNLRGFGKEDEYLKFWVPGTDNYQSYVNLVDALIESKIYIFKISFDKLTEDENFFKKIDDNLLNISKYNKINNKEYEINININEYLKSKKRSKSKNNQEIEIKFDKTKVSKIQKNNINIIPIYKKSLSKLSPKNYNRNIKNIEENYYEQKFESIKLFIQIKNDIITDVFHSSNDNSEIEKLINLFFDLIINKNIQEAADHSVIYLEGKIRSFDNKDVSPGIILPGQGGEYFNILNQIIRKIFNEYKIKNNIKFDINREYFKLTSDWKILPEEKKLKKINLILDEIKRGSNSLTQDSILVNKIENHFKINLNVDKNFSKLQSEKNILLEIEKKLKTLDQTLEVFVDEILDQNKLRLKNSPQKI